MGQFIFGFVTGIAVLFVSALIYQLTDKDPYEDPEMVRLKVQAAYLQGKIDAIDWMIDECEDDPIEDSIEG